MRSRLIAIAALAALFCSPAVAAPTWAPSQGGAAGPVVSCTDLNGNTIRCIQPSVTLNDATGAAIGTSGNPLITSASTAGATTAPVTAGAATATNSILQGCRYVSTLDTFANSNQGALTCGTRGSLHVELWSSDTTTPIFSTTAADGGSLNGQTGLLVTPRTMLYNGTTWDRAFTCTSTAAVNVTAANTTQIVALSGTTVVRVCAIALSMSAAGTAGIYTGTGTNCATGLAALVQDMTLPTGSPLTLSAPVGGSLVRSTAGGEICVKAVTGNVTGFISYAQF